MIAHNPKQLQAVVEAAAPDLELSFRPMFGGIMGYAGGAAFLSLSNVGLGVKLSGVDREVLLAAGGEALRYEPDSPPSKSYVVVPPAMLDDAPALHGWLTRAAAGLKPKPARK